MKRHYRVVGIAQVYNEHASGHLERFLKYFSPLVDELVIYDDGSTDGSRSIIEKYTPHILGGGDNQFQQEMRHKQDLLNKALELKADFVLWLDADEVMSANAEQDLQKVCRWMDKENIDGAAIHELNLWRSNNYRRVDSNYDEGWFVRLWRVTPEIGYKKVRSGLHLPSFPSSFKNIQRTNLFQVIHYGFATDADVLKKYLRYRQHGQRNQELQRLIDETGLSLAEVPKEVFPKGLYLKNLKPLARPLHDWLKLADEHEQSFLRPRVSIVAMIYKSTAWLQFVYDQVLKHTDLADTEFFFVANDATPEVLGYLKDNYIPHYVFNANPAQKKEWYINNVYRAWNYGAEMARGDYVLFINSDMAFSPNWVPNLFKAIDESSCVASRLVESGKLKSGTYGIEKNFGLTPDQYDEQGFLAYTQQIRESSVKDGGLFMPLLIKREQFLSVGGYPEGNVVPKSDPFKPKIARQGQSLVSGDVILMEKLKHKGVQHKTAFDSIAYHFQEGEMGDKPTRQTKTDSRMVITNDTITGHMGEKSMWNFLSERLPSSYALDKNILGVKSGFEVKARQFITTNLPKAKVIIQNATFMDLVNPEMTTVAYLQDDLRRMNRKNRQQEQNIRQATHLVTNSYLTASSYADQALKIIPIGVDDQLFSPGDQAKSRKKLGLSAKSKIGIFVGDLTAVKGWPEIEAIIKKRRDIHWLIVSKQKESYKAANVTMFSRINQKKLAELHTAADFFILGSPVETQCLAAIEANLCGLPVLMHNTGIYADFSSEEKAAVGIFAEKLDEQIDNVLTGKFSPRQLIQEKGLTVAGMIARWHNYLEQVFLEANQRQLRASTVTSGQRYILRFRRQAQNTGRQVFRASVWLAKKIFPEKVITRLYLFLRRLNG